MYRFGKSAANRQFVVYYLENRTVEQFRLGISVSKKVGTAVVRNRMRRLVKEIVRHHERELSPHHDFVFIVRKPALPMDYGDLEKSVLHVLKKAALVRHKNNGPKQ